MRRVRSETGEEIKVEKITTLYSDEIIYSDDDDVYSKDAKFDKDLYSTISAQKPFCCLHRQSFGREQWRAFVNKGNTLRTFLGSLRARICKELFFFFYRVENNRTKRSDRKTLLKHDNCYCRL